MSTILFDRIVYGPVHSRRLGVSLGVNLSPTDGKRCSFNCIYCECGLNEERPAKLPPPKREEVKKALSKALNRMSEEDVTPDVITFSGNGEPTMHPDFAAIIDDTIALRNALCPKAKVAVLSNSTMIFKDEIVEALCKVDDNLMKLDAVRDDFIQAIDQPLMKNFTAEKLIANLCKFNGYLTIQTIFIRGEHNGIKIDNTKDEDVTQWIEALKRIHPQKVMIYTISRETPVKTLEKVPMETLQSIAERVRESGFPVSVAG